MSVPETTKILDEQVKAISGMTRSELMAWINERLNRRDIVLEDDEEDSSSYPIVALMRHVSLPVAEAIQNAVADLLRIWVKDQTITSGDDLLLLVQGLRVHSARPDLEAIARSEGFSAFSEELQYRLLQTLIALNANLEPSFWYRIFSASPTELAGIAFDGLALISPNHAVDFLSTVPGDPLAAEQIAIALPGFMDDIVPARDRASIRSLIESRIPEIQPPLVQTLTDFFAAEQTPLSVLPLEESAAVRKRKGDWIISSENFPAISSLGEKLDQIFEAGPENPAKLFANLAHQ